MKLFNVIFDNGLPHEDNNRWAKLMVFKNIEDAELETDKLCNEYFEDYEEPSVEIEEINELDGYEVVLIKKS